MKLWKLFILFLPFILLILFLPCAQAQQMPVIPQTCEDKLATSEKFVLIVRDDLSRWQNQFVQVWNRAEKAEAQVQQLQDELRKLQPQPPQAPNGKGTN